MGVLGDSRLSSLRKTKIGMESMWFFMDFRLVHCRVSSILNLSRKEEQKLILWIHVFGSSFNLIRASHIKMDDVSFFLGALFDLCFFSNERFCFYIFRFAHIIPAEVDLGYTVSRGLLHLCPTYPQIESHEK
jgi:hypothetical protein